MLKRLDIRLSDEDKKQAIEQANKLDLTVSDYIRLIIKLDVMTGIVQKLRDEQRGQGD